jgi:spermidine/putrescine transport system ATP-binding protein
VSAAGPDTEVRDVVKRFGDGPSAVDGISFAVERGEFFSLLGPSGCGKTTTLRMIAGLETPTAGQVFVRGEEMGRRPPHRRPTNTVFQRPALFPHLTVADNIGFGLRIDGLSRRESAARVRESLQLVDLGGYESRRPHELSGGQQQRVSIARALVKKPAVLLLDEPLSALDLRLRVQMQDLLQRVQAESGTTFVYVTHDQTEALAMSHRIAIMNRGRIEQLGPPEEIYSRPRTRFVATFVGDINIFDGTSDGNGGLVSDGVKLTVPGPGVATLVRPERVLVAPALERRPGWNVFDAVVEGTVFHGANVRYRLKLANGRTVVSERPNDGSSPIGAGESVQLGWDASSAAMLQA